MILYDIVAGAMLMHLAAVCLCILQSIQVVFG